MDLDDLNTFDSKKMFEVYDSWPEKNVFGWAKLKNTGTSLELLGSAVAYESSGLIVGTAAVIPEVSTSLLFLLGASLGLICGRRACKGLPAIIHPLGQ